MGKQSHGLGGQFQAAPDLTDPTCAALVSGPYQELAAFPLLRYVEGFAGQPSGVQASWAVPASLRGLPGFSVGPALLRESPGASAAPASPAWNREFSSGLTVEPFPAAVPEPAVRQEEA